MHTDDELLRRARRRVNLKLGWALHAGIYLLVNGGLAAMSLFMGRQWFVFPLLGWALGLAIHGVVVLANLYGDGTRQRMLQREVDTLMEGARR
jgi:hypothetical protein